MISIKVLIVASLFLILCLGQNPSQLWTYRLTQSSGSVNFFTSSNSRKILRSDAIPTATGSGIHLESAKNEYEPFQIAIGPNSNLGTVTVSVDPFPNLANQIITVDSLNYHETQTQWPEYLVTATQITVDNSRNNLIWVTVYVPPTATAGYYTTNMRIGSYTIPITLYVFNFALPTKYNFHSHLGASSTDDNMKQIFFNHRASPTGGPTWPSGFNYAITYDASNNNCSYFNDESVTERNVQYQLKALADKWIKGIGWNGVGFTDTVFVNFVSNSQQRPTKFCGYNSVDNYGRATAGTPTSYADLAALPYNVKWQNYCKALRDYLANNGMLNKGYYYVQNEPQNQEDYDQAAFLSRLIKAVAPDLKIMISEEMKPGICENTKFGNAKYDIWIASLVQFDLPGNKEYAQTRMKNNPDEMLWLYSLEQDSDPYYNPTQVNRQGMHVRIISWAGWKWRANGWGYYAINQFFTGSKPNLRFELFRESSEDYEYLFMANGNKYPDFASASVLDPMIETVASSLKTWNQDGDAHAKLRQELGLYLEGKRTTLPTLLASCPNANPLQKYSINFQDPKVDYGLGAGWIKQGWGPDFNVDKTKGFTGNILTNTARQLYSFIDDSGFSVQTRTSIFDDYGKAFTYNWCVPNGKYNVTVSIGRATKGYSCCHYLEVEGVVWFNQATTPSNSILAKSAIVDLNDCCLTFSVGDNNEYTFLDYIIIDPVTTPTTVAPQIPSTLTPSTLTPTTKPSTLTPSTLTPSTLTPSTLRPSTLTPSTLTPSTLRPSTLTPSTLTPSTLTPSTIRPSTLTPSTLTPSTLTPSTLTPSTLTPSTIQPTVPSGRVITVSNNNDILSAIANAKARDTITISPGTYTFNLARINVVNLPNATLRATSKQTVFINFVNPGSSVVEGFVVESSSGWVFENLVIEGKCADPSYCDHAFHIKGTSSNLIIRNNEIINFNYQIKVNSATSISGLIVGNNFYDRVPRPSSTYKITITGGNNWIIKGNYFHDFSTSSNTAGGMIVSSFGSVTIDSNLILNSKSGTSFGVYLKDANGVSYIMNNIIASTSDVGIYLERATLVNIFNNIIYDTVGVDIRFSPSNAILRNNLYNGRFKNRESGVSTVGANVLVGDLATFNTYVTNPTLYDFRLTTAGRTAVNGKGDTTDVKFDYCLNNRASPYDIGPFDLKGASCASNLPIYVSNPSASFRSLVNSSPVKSSTSSNNTGGSSPSLAVLIVAPIVAFLVVALVVAFVVFYVKKQSTNTNQGLEEPLLEKK